MVDVCPICKRNSEIIPFDQKDAQTVKCVCCGLFHISRTANVTLTNMKLDDTKQAALSHWVFINSREKGKEVFITHDLLMNILPNLKIPSADEQFRNLILYLGNKADSPEKLITIATERFPTVIGSNGMEGVNYVINFLIKKELVYCSERTNFIKLNLTPEGWEKYGTIKRGDVDSKLVFMAMEYNKPETEKAYEFFKDAVKETGFELKKLDEILKAGLIDDQLRVRIRQSKFILSDLTYKNAGAYWEAGFAEGLGKQVIYLCERSHWEANKTHFDTNHHTTVHWSLDTIKDDMKKLKATIRESFPGEAIMEVN